MHRARCTVTLEGTPDMVFTCVCVASCMGPRAVHMDATSHYESEDMFTCKITLASSLTK
jgi:hypothetical protein